LAGLFCPPLSPPPASLFPQLTVSSHTSAPLHKRTADLFPDTPWPPGSVTPFPPSAQKAPPPFSLFHFHANVSALCGSLFSKTVYRPIHIVGPVLFTTPQIVLPLLLLYLKQKWRAARRFFFFLPQFDAPKLPFDKEETCIPNQLPVPTRHYTTGRHPTPPPFFSQMRACFHFPQLCPSKPCSKRSRARLFFIYISSGRNSSVFSRSEIFQWRCSLTYRLALFPDGFPLKYYEVASY